MAGVQQLLDCMISSWYPNFQRTTFKTVILPLPQPVLDWLVSDGLHLPDDSQAVRRTSCRSNRVMSCRFSQFCRCRRLLLLPPLLLQLLKRANSMHFAACSSLNGVQWTNMPWMMSIRSGLRATARPAAIWAQTPRAAPRCR